MFDSMRTTLTAGSRRNLAIIVSSASLAVLGVGGGAALALTSGGDPDPEPPVLTDTKQPDHGTAPQPDHGTTAPDEGTTPPPDQGTTPPDQGTTPPGDTDTANADLPSAQAACDGDAAGELVGQPQEGTLDDGRKFIGYLYVVDGVDIVAMDVGADDVIDYLFADVDGDDEFEAQAVCGQDTDWTPVQG
ncbi:MAG TPA: hypothetical protein VNT03_17725 [Baekduia sp.]|nr:hypothetical protein [Baekduia sp.]